MEGEQIPRWKRSLIQAMAIFFLLSSWWVASGWINELAICALVPYDDVWPEFRPLPGTWYRDLNDFFEGPPWRYLPACLSVGVSIALFLLVHRRAYKSPSTSIRLALTFALSNFLLVACALYSAFHIGDLLPELPRSVYGRYGYTYGFILVDTLLVVLWWAIQAWGITKWVSVRAMYKAVSQ